MDARPRASFALRPVLLVAAATVAVLLAVSGQYGFHRDELYFVLAGQHPAFGYVDQPPLTPLLAAASAALLGVTPTAIRILPALAIGIAVILAAATAREMGGGRTAQVVAAVCLAGSFALAVGHLMHTTTFDVLAWTVILWLVARLLRGADQRLWLAVGVAAGIGLENKTTLAFLGIALVAGLLLARRWEVFRSRWAWGAVAVAVIIWLPNLAWQAANGWPQLDMARSIAADDGAENQSMLLPIQLIGSGILLFPVMLAGVAWLIFARRGRPWRAIGLGYPVILAVLFATSGKGYYAAGYFAALMAAGAIVVEQAIDRARRRSPRLGVALTGGFAATAAASAALTAVLVLPIVPASAVADTPIPDVYGESIEQLGWPELVATVQEAVDGLTPEQRDGAIIYADNYGEAGALHFLGGERGLPNVYSGHNAMWDFGAPPDTPTGVVIAVAPDLAWGLETFSAYFGGCRAAGVIDNGVGADNEEQDGGVYVCKGPTQPWSQLWPLLRHLD